MKCLECNGTDNVSERHEPFLKDLYGEDTPILLCDRCYREEVSPLEGSNATYVPVVDN